MKATDAKPTKNFLILAGLGFGTTAVLLIAGFVPTQRLGGSDAVVAMLVGCAVSLFGSLLGSLPILSAQQTTPQSLLQGQLLAMLVRMMVVLVVALSVTLSGWFDRVALLVWVALSYMALLIPETMWIVRRIRAVSINESR